MNYWKVAFLIFYDRQGKILLNHRFESSSRVEDIWELMGGSVRENEQPTETIKREIKEELNYELDELEDELVMVDRYEISIDDRFYEVYFFKAKYPGLENFSDSNEVKVSDLKLFAIDEALARPLLPITKEILRNFLKQESNLAIPTADL